MVNRREHAMKRSIITVFGFMLSMVSFLWGDPVEAGIELVQPAIVFDERSASEKKSPVRVAWANDEAMLVKIHSNGKQIYPTGNKQVPVSSGMTASGTPARKGTIAADTRRYPFGTIMYVPGYGYGQVEDRGGSIKSNKIDLFFASHKKALQWGRQQKRVSVWLR